MRNQAFCWSFLTCFEQQKSESTHLGVAPREVLSHLRCQVTAVHAGGRVLEQRDQVDRIVGATRLSMEAAWSGGPSFHCAASCQAQSSALWSAPQAWFCPSPLQMARGQSASGTAQSGRPARRRCLSQTASLGSHAVGVCRVMIVLTAMLASSTLCRRCIPAWNTVDRPAVLCFRLRGIRQRFIVAR